MLSYLIVSLVSLTVSALTLFSGFGLGTLLMPVFAMFFPIEVAIAATAIVHLANNIFKVFLVGRMAHWATVFRFAIPASLAAIVGAYLLTTLGTIKPIAVFELLGRNWEIEPIKLAIGLILIIFAAVEVVPQIKRLSFSPKLIPLGGILSGFFGGLSGIQGALRSMFLIRANLTKEQFIGTTVISAVIVDISRLGVYGGVMYSENFSKLRHDGVLSLVAVGTLFAITGSLVGVKLLPKVTLRTVQMMVATLLFVVGLGLCVGLL